MNSHETEKDKGVPYEGLRGKSHEVRIDPMFNDAFVHVFGRSDSRNVTKAFINSVFRNVGIDEIDEIDSIHAEYTDMGEVVGCKATRFDVLIFADNQIVDLEAERHDTQLGDRAMLYGARLLSTHTELGLSYADMPQVVIVLLIDVASQFDAGDDLVFASNTSWFVNGQPVYATEKLKIVAVNLRKARKRYNRFEDIPDDEMAAWLYILANGYKSNEEIERTVEKFPSIEEFAKRYGKAISDPSLMAAYEQEARNWRESESFERWLADKESNDIEQGLEQGLEQATALLAEMGLGEEAIEEFAKNYRRKTER
ncbi:MAG: PD-(D/E)XK nuclease family transposase [Eggerthellaceae bacterium]|nr:PD-(D/E)XK nuclease family transposase [Eggerthellaceae bacterium]